MYAEPRVMAAHSIQLITQTPVRACSPSTLPVDTELHLVRLKMSMVDSVLASLLLFSMLDC